LIKAPQFGHRRKNPLTGDWVLISPHRLDRPWQGAMAPAGEQAQRPAYDPQCYLCAGNSRASGEVNPPYQGVYVFDNDFPALASGDPPDQANETDPLFAWTPARGCCRVVCFSADHSRTLSEMSHSQITALIVEWRKQTEELGQRFPEGSVQIFENKGELMGCSNPHPHGQIWAQNSIPTLLQKELDSMQQYHQLHGEKLLVDYAQQELANEDRVVISNQHFVVVVPYWATWPFETLICPLRGATTLLALSTEEIDAFADVLRGLSIRYDNLFGVPFPYSSGLHQAPPSGQWDPSFSLHMHFYPPLLRSATVRKFMVGYEMLAEAQRDLTPENAAAVLRELRA